jgi:hypothetical protein
MTGYELPRCMSEIQLLMFPHVSSGVGSGLQNIHVLGLFGFGR